MADENTSTDETNTETGATPPPAQPPADKPAEPKPSEDLSKLREALDKERSLRKDAEKRAKDGDAHRAKLDELESASKSDLDKAVDAARKEGAGQALASANTRLIAAEARALAAEAKFRNPQLAVRAIDLADVKVTADGVIDTAAISAALKTLSADEPYLLADNGPRVPKPDPTQGARNSTTTGVDVGREMYEARRPKRTPAT